MIMTAMRMMMIKKFSSQGGNPSKWGGFEAPAELLLGHIHHHGDDIYIYISKTTVSWTNKSPHTGESKALAGLDEHCQ